MLEKDGKAFKIENECKFMMKLKSLLFTVRFTIKNWGEFMV